MSGQQYNPFAFFIVLSLLALTPPQVLNKSMESLSFALGATAKSVENIKKGMETLNSGLQQFAQHSTGTGGFQQGSFGGNVKESQSANASILPVETAGREHGEDGKQQEPLATDNKTSTKDTSAPENNQE